MTDWGQAVGYGKISILARFLQVLITAAEFEEFALKSIKTSLRAMKIHRNLGVGEDRGIELGMQLKVIIAAGILHHQFGVTDHLGRIDRMGK